MLLTVNIYLFRCLCFAFFEVADVIDNLGVGPFLAKEVTLGASIWLAAGSQLIVVSAVTLAISGEWNLAGWQRSSVFAAFSKYMEIGYHL